MLNRSARLKLPSGRIRIDGVKFANSSLGPRPQLPTTFQRANTRRPDLVTRSMTGPGRPPPTWTSLTPPKPARFGGRGEPVGAGPCIRAAKGRFGLRRHEVRRPPTKRVPVI